MKVVVSFKCMNFCRTVQILRLNFLILYKLLAIQFKFTYFLNTILFLHMKPLTNGLQRIKKKRK